MPASKAKRLSSIFRSAGKLVSSAHADDVAVKHCVSSLDTSSTSSFTLTNRSIKLPKQPSSHSSKPLSHLAVERFKLHDSAASDYDESTKQLSREISAILSEQNNFVDTLSLNCSLTSQLRMPTGLCTLLRHAYWIMYFVASFFNSAGGTDFDSLDSEVNDGQDAEICLDIPWFSTVLHSNISLRRKEISRDRKQKWVFKGTQTNRFQRLVNMCAQKLVSDAAIQVFGKLGRETGVKEYNALIRLYIDKARKTEDEEESLQQIYKAYKLFKSMGNRVFR